MVRLKDIAAQAGVSVMTVSKACGTSRMFRLRPRPASNFWPSNWLRAKFRRSRLRTRTTKLFGLGDPIAYQSDLVSDCALHRGARVTRSYDILLPKRWIFPSAKKPASAASCRGEWMASSSPGVSNGHQARIYKEFSRAAFRPCCWTYRALCNQFINVETDDLLASYTETQHCSSSAQKDRVFAGPQATPWTQERLEGYRRALREADLEVNDKLILRPSHTIEEGGKTALQMINESPMPRPSKRSMTWWRSVAPTPLKQGVKIPERYRCRIRNILLSEHFRVPLTTVNQPSCAG